MDIWDRFWAFLGVLRGTTWICVPFPSPRSNLLLMGLFQPVLSEEGFGKC